MLVLSRERDESLIIGDDIEVRVVDIRGEKVRLGVVAPRSVSVHRLEVYQQIKRDAAAMPTDDGAVKARPLRLAVLVSGGAGSTLKNLMDRIAAGRLNAEIKVVIASRPGTGGVAHAQAAGIPNHVFDRKAIGDFRAFNDAVFQAIDRADVDLVVLGAWLSLLDIPERYAGRVMNVHPALLPSFGGQGMFGTRVHEAVLAHGCKVSGCTVHFVDNEYDAGPIILQRTVPVRDTDTAFTLATRVGEQEREAYPEAIEWFRAGRLAIDQRVVHITAPK